LSLDMVVVCWSDLVVVCWSDLVFLRDYVCCLVLLFFYLYLLSFMAFWFNLLLLRSGNMSLLTPDSPVLLSSSSLDIFVTLSTFWLELMTEFLSNEFESSCFRFLKHKSKSWLSKGACS
jgi:hypothetical protein